MPNSRRRRQHRQDCMLPPHVKRGLGRIALRLSAIARHTVLAHRAAHRLYVTGHPAAANVVSAINRVVTGAEIEPEAVFGPGFSIHHGNGIVISGQVRAGRDLHIYQQVTLGESWGGKAGAPVIGDRVHVFAGAKILGGVSIEDDAVIGANAVVLQDVPAGAMAVGIPARIIYSSGPRAWETRTGAGDLLVDGSEHSVLDSDASGPSTRPSRYDQHQIVE
jgi:serine O-acetyltransferase